ncbi:hypothetical protein D6C94_04880 [Aureobasidium pullulans]|uniref:Uncharacterized protein n=1 Tax=Aureobasidium pullulans TaxID=5580 RepID=A0AB38LY38_AURPU|nr:hypothetical protein D6C94_04880 [Aureobasidium pullulans]
MALRKIFTKVWWSTLVHGKQAQPVPSNFFTGGNQIHRPQDVRLHTLAASTAILKARPQQSMTLNEVHESLQGSMDEIRTEIVKSKGKCREYIKEQAKELVQRRNSGSDEGIPSPRSHV